MTHYRMLDRAPSVVITSNRNELKLYQGNQVYLNDGDNFELRFFNPLPEKIGVEINFNGIKKGDSYLVLNPGQDIVLDRFLDEQRKMLFETYVVDGNNEAAVKAIEQNGVITFNFHKERYSSNSYQNDVKIKYDFPPKPYVPIYHTNTPYNITNNNYYYGISGATYTYGSSGYSGISGTSGMSGISGRSGYSGTGGGTISSMNYSTNLMPTSMQQDYWFPSTNNTSPVMDTFSHTNFLDANLESSIAFSEYVCENTERSIDYSDYIKKNLSKQLETGRIEKGDISSQTLKGVNLNFNPIAFHTVTYKLMPISALNRTIGEVRQYCTHCGYRIRKNTWDYCPKCGSHLD